MIEQSVGDLRKKDKRRGTEKATEEYRFERERGGRSLYAKRGKEDEGKEGKETDNKTV